jgi:Tfp pilus assembly protein FimT
MPCSKGFSLLETLVILSITAILVTLSFPLLRYFLNRHQDEMLQSQLQQAIETASQEARIKGVPIGLCASQTGTRCRGEWQEGLLLFIDEKEDGVIHDQAQRLAVFSLKSAPGKLHARSYPAYRQHLLFMPSGLMPSDNATFWFCYRERTQPSWAMMLSKSGNTRLVYPDQDGVIKDAQQQPLRC